MRHAYAMRPTFSILKFQLFSSHSGAPAYPQNLTPKKDAGNLTLRYHLHAA